MKLMSMVTRLKKNVWPAVYARRIKDWGVVKAIPWAVKQYGLANERQIRPIAQAVASKIQD